MSEIQPYSARRSFMKKGLALMTGLTGLSALAKATASPPLPGNEDLYLIGPRSGYSPQVGTLVSMMNFMRNAVINTVKDLTKEQLDHAHDANANSIGALILHLGATEKFYQINSFEGRQEFNESEKKIWEAPMRLGDLGRKTIKGQNVNYYLDIISEVRQKTLDEFKKKDDQWLLAVDPEWSKPDEQINTYWKWFHVCEHESNHRGQIKWLKGRLPGATPGND